MTFELDKRTHLPRLQKDGLFVSSACCRSKTSSELFQLRTASSTTSNFAVTFNTTHLLAFLILFDLCDRRCSASRDGPQRGGFVVAFLKWVNHLFQEQGASDP